MSAPLLRSLIVHQLFGVDVSGGEALAGDVVARIPADDLTRRILNKDYTAMPDPENPDREWEPEDLLRLHLIDRKLVLPQVLPDVPEDAISGRFTPEPTTMGDEVDLLVAKLAAAAAVAEAVQQAAETPDDVPASKKKK